jgi:hypothetical protein
MKKTYISLSIKVGILSLVLVIAYAIQTQTDTEPTKSETKSKIINSNTKTKPQAASDILPKEPIMLLDTKPKQAAVFNEKAVALAIAKADRAKHKKFIANHPYKKRKLTPKEWKGIPKKDRPDLAMELEFLKTVDPNTRTVPRERLNKARDEVKKYFAKTDKAAIPNTNWTERGPNNVGGRTRALLFDPNDASNKKVWAGGVAGGLWFNTDITNANTAWTRVDDFWSNIAISSIAFDPSNMQTAYAGTGEGFFNADAVQGEGIWKTTNGGTTWTQLTATKPSTNANFLFIQKIVVNNAGHIFAATRGASFNIGGIMKSTDGGTSWTKVFAPLSGIGTTTIGDSDWIGDIELAANGDIYAGVGTIFVAGRVFRSTNGGTNWTNITPASGGQRVEIALAPSASSVTASTVLYAVASNEEGNIAWFKKSSNGGSTWTDVSIPIMTDSDGSNPEFTRGQAWYDLILAVQPTNANVVLAGGIDIHKSIDGGANWEQVTSWFGGFGASFYSHADQHAMAFRPNNNNQMIFGNDGGVDYSTDAGSTSAPTASTPTFATRNNGYNVTQFYACAMRNTAESNQFLAGAQDNGTQRFSTAGVGATTEATGGDGAFCFIDQDNPNFQISSYINNNYYLSTNGGASFTITLAESSGGSFINPADYDNTANILYSAGDSDGDLVSEFRRIRNITTTPTSQEILDAGLEGDQITALRADAFTVNRVFIGTASGGVYVIDNAHATTPTLNDITGTMPAGYVNAIDIGASDSELIVVRSSYGIKSVYYSNDGGSTWASKDESTHGLPDMPIRWALFNPKNTKQVLVATELGVWSTNDITASNPGWEPTNTGLANVRCDMLQYRTSDGLVAVATHGRGLFTSDVFANTPPLITTLNPANNSINFPIENNLLITFNENVQKGTTGNIRIRRFSDNTTVETIAITDAKITITGAVLSINPATILTAETKYYVETDANTVKDLVGNSFAGITGNTVWAFTTLETTPPTIASLNPVNNATNFPGANNLVATFSENIQKGTTGNIRIRRFSDNSTLETIPIADAKISISGAALTINPATDLTFNTKFYVEIDANSIKDLVGNNFAGITGNTIWAFTTDISTSVEDELLAKAITIYPNPTADNLYIDAANQQALGKISLTIIDQQGKVCWKSGKNYLQNKQILDMKNLNAGIYWLKIDNGKGIAWKQIVRQ